MADVYDRWHRSRAKAGEPVCREHEKPPTADHGTGKRWQVRYRDAEGRQRKENFARKPDADARAQIVGASLLQGAFVDLQAGKIKLKVFGEQWLADQPFDNASTREAVEQRLRLHVFADPIGDKELRAIAPSTLQAWISRKKTTLAAGTVRTIYACMSAVLSAAVDNGRLAKSPMKAASVKPPAAERSRVTPWSVERTAAVREAMPGRYQTLVDAGAGLGQRQGEVFGLSLDDVDFLGRGVHVRRQVKIVGGQLVFAPPKGGKERDVPLPESIGLRLAAHVAAYPPVAVTLPWKEPGGRSLTARLLFTTRAGSALNRTYINTYVWKPALEAAEVIPAAKPGQRREPAREHGFHALRHHFASVLLAAGVDVRTLAEMLGHTDPGFTLRTYTHLMPGAGERMRKAVDGALSGRPIDDPAIAQVP